MRLNPEIEIELVFDDKELDLKYSSSRYWYFYEKTKTIKLYSKKIS